jgi:hypothetical protein
VQRALAPRASVPTLCRADFFATVRISSAAQNGAAGRSRAAVKLAQKSLRERDHRDVLVDDDVPHVRAPPQRRARARARAAARAPTTALSQSRARALSSR